MKLLLSLTLLCSVCFSAQARKPAVEDFVGVESEHYKKTPKGTEVLFNFGNQIKAVSTQQTPSTTSSWFSIFTLSAFIALPFLMWFSISSMNNKTNTAYQAPTYKKQEDSVVPVTHLEDYRKSSENEDDDIKKVS